jgi:hypothetical protein
MRKIGRQLGGNRKRNQRTHDDSARSFLSSRARGRKGRFEERFKGEWGREGPWNWTHERIKSTRHQHI